MHDSRGVSGRETIRDLHGDVEQLAHISQRADRLAVDVLHHDVVFAYVVKRRDVGVIQRGNGPRFALEAITECGLRELDGDHAVESCVTGFPDLSHAARANRGKELVWPEAG